MNDYVIQKLLRALGFPASGGEKGFAVPRMLGSKGRQSPVTKEREKFEEDVREQFRKLKEKGISIPVFTL